MSDPIFPLPQVAEGTNQIDIEVNDGWLRLEALGRAVLGIDDSPPTSNNGDVYIVGPSPSGAFSTFDTNDITIYYDGLWYAWAPVEGVQAVGYLYSGSSGWIAGGGSGAVDSVNGQTGTVVLALDDLDDVDAASPSDGDVLTWNNTDGEWQPAPSSGGGGLTNWTDGLNSSAPNATVPVATFTATNAATNVDAATVAKGNGATLAQVPDATTTGGNKRGNFATDFQKNRSAATQVAKGDYSVISGGRNNTALGNESAIGGGIGNAQNQQRGFIGAGSANTGGDTTFIGGGLGNDTASAQYGAISGGQGNQLTGAGSWIPGGIQATDRGVRGTGAWSAGQFSVNGDAQVQEFVLRSDTTNATPEEMTTTNAAAATTNTVNLPNNSAYDVQGRIVARDSSGNAQTWIIDAMIVRGANAASTTLTGGGTPTAKFTQGTFTGTVALSANTTTGGLAVTVTGVAATNIKWVASLQATQVVG